MSDQQLDADDTMTLSELATLDVNSGGTAPLVEETPHSTGTQATTPLRGEQNGGAGAFPLVTVFWLCAVGFLVNCQPSEPYLTKYMLTNKNLTETQVVSQVYPGYTIGSLLFLLPVGWLADSWSHRGVIGIGLAARLATRVILVLGNSVGMMTLMQYTYALATACVPVQFSFVYRVVAEEHYTKATSLVLLTYHFGNVLGSLIGELAVDSATEPASYDLVQLFYLSFGFTVAGTITFAFFFPRARFPAPESLFTLYLVERAKQSRLGGVRSVVGRIVELYTKSGSLTAVWTMWYTLGASAYMIWSNYYQVQLYDLDPNLSFGYIEMVNEIAHSLGSMLPWATASYVCFRFCKAFSKQRRDVLFIIVSCMVCSSMIAGSLTLASAQGNPTGVYSFNVVYILVYGMQDTVSSVSLARGLKECNDERYPVLFSTNAFVSLCLVTAVQQTAILCNTTASGFMGIAAIANVVAVVLCPLVWVLARHVERRSFRRTGDHLEEEPCDMEMHSREAVAIA